MKTQTFTFPLGISDVLNANHRDHWRVKANKVRAIRTIAYVTARNKGVKPLERAHCTCTLHFGDKRRRDPSNWSDTAKAAVDGLVDAGLLVDDDHKHLVGPDMRIGLVGTRGIVTIALAFEAIA